MPGGEVDIVARRGKIVAFVEVKARASESVAAMSLDAWRIRRVVVAAERLAQRYQKAEDDIRIDGSSSSPAGSPAMCRTSGKGDKALGLN